MTDAFAAGDAMGTDSIASGAVEGGDGLDGGGFGGVVAPKPSHMSNFKQLLTAERACGAGGGKAETGRARGGIDAKSGKQVGRKARRKARKKEGKKREGRRIRSA